MIVMGELCESSVMVVMRNRRQSGRLAKLATQRTPY
jgi:hypothetical protein